MRLAPRSHAPIAAALLVLVPGNGDLLALGVLLGAPAVTAGALLLYRRPWLAPWGAVLIFTTSAELRLRVTPAIGSDSTSERGMGTSPG